MEDLFRIAVDKNASVASCLRDWRNWNPQFSWSIQDWELESVEIVFDSILPTIHGEDQIFWRPLKQEILKFTHTRMHFGVLEVLFFFGGLFGVSWCYERLPPSHGWQHWANF